MKPVSSFTTTVDLYFVTLRNPWGGRMGRQYQFKLKLRGKTVQSVLSASEMPSTGEEGTFDLELNDLTKRFDRMYVARGDVPMENITL